MTAKSAERDVAISELANHLERCPAGRTALLTWIEKKLANIALNPVPTAADATWLIESAYIQ
ncbi:MULTISPECIES: hypothetical protein [Pseudomonas syringae group]|uniref:Uncharacterized protein n=2 Tax=Pseudomonas syringae group TaxID=136849 RepID=A0A0P9NLG1_PSESX|nr:MULTISPECIES: hypothetical protein [Pseudomonas syringae group]KPW98242.1 Uncharacterized protein ALO50_02605 [Pseudomonas syringae pv. cerasicola]KWS88336.1 hypothetical protein AL049_26280 [Pseudomonas syringae pv. cerasicola]PHN78248.1 hypothetical protein AO272_06735 [Pseudomonas syringae pv. cerasicola]PHN78883.1 hypothetical protein AO252_11460 [Pseudomonas syringae pv. cerasicola]RMS77714.1 hypothetical protein ALP61_01945 [Pseudomonas savastanoi]